MGKIVFNLVKGRKKIVDLFIFRFIKIPPGADSNNLKHKIIFSPFEGNSQHFPGPCTELKSSHSKWNFGLGALYKFGTICPVAVFSPWVSSLPVGGWGHEG